MTTIFDIIKAQSKRKKAEQEACSEAVRVQRRQELQALALEADIAFDGRKNRTQKALIKAGFKGDFTNL